MTPEQVQALPAGKWRKLLPTLPRQTLQQILAGGDLRPPHRIPALDWLHHLNRVEMHRHPLGALLPSAHYASDHCLLCVGGYPFQVLAGTYGPHVQPDWRAGGSLQLWSERLVARGLLLSDDSTPTKELERVFTLSIARREYDQALAELAPLIEAEVLAPPSAWVEYLQQQAPEPWTRHRVPLYPADWTWAEPSVLWRRVLGHVRRDGTPALAREVAGLRPKPADGWWGLLQKMSRFARIELSKEGAAPPAPPKL